MSLLSSTFFGVNKELGLQKRTINQLSNDILRLQSTLNTLALLNARINNGNLQLLNSNTGLYHTIWLQGDLTIALGPGEA